MDGDDVCVLLTSQEPLSRLVFSSPANRDLRVDAPSGGDDGDNEAVIGSRDPTPAPESVSHSPPTEIQLVLRFSRPPKNPRLGWCFGRDSTCDVKLYHQDLPTSKYVSGKHFYIRVTEQGWLFLVDESTHGTAVGYNHNSLHLKEIRTKETWLLSQTAQDGPLGSRIVISLKGGTRFKLAAPSADAKRIQLFENCQSALPAFDLLGLHSGSSTAQPSQPETPRSRARPALYLPLEHVGSGTFGNISKVIRLRDGAKWASKTLRASVYRVQSKRKHGESATQLEREVRLMRQATHVNVMPVVDFVLTPQTTLYMPFFEAGSMEDHRGDFSEAQIVCVARQMLVGIDFLHGKGIIHRDLKPANMLLDLEGNRIRVVIGDFGLSKMLDATMNTATYCGTMLYNAPEIGRGQYGNGVDEFAVGMVMNDFLHGFPHDIQPIGGPRWMQARRSRIADLDDDQVSGIIQGLTDEEPETRLSAKECLDKGCKDGLWKLVNGAVVDVCEVEATGLRTRLSTRSSARVVSTEQAEQTELVTELVTTIAPTAKPEATTTPPLNKQSREEKPREEEPLKETVQTSEPGQKYQEFWHQLQRALQGQPASRPSLPDTDSSGSYPSISQMQQPRLTESS